tara:strand:+ start:410 stop:1099 length:690 start_codon:yes stop_codon:yes gene_type:complete
MCFDEKTSWLTLSIGSIINIGVLLYLGIEHNKSHNNLIYPIVIVLYFQYTLLMQIPDGIAWRQLRKNKKIEPSTKNLAFGLNTTQPLISGLLVFMVCIYTKQPLPVQFWIGVVLLLIYISLLSFEKVTEAKMAPTPQCKHLLYEWWSTEDEKKNIRRTTQFVLYAIIILLFVSVLPQLWWATGTAIFLGTLALTTYMYPCSNGSLWCWSIAYASIVVLIVDTMQRKVFK